MFIRLTKIIMLNIYRLKFEVSRTVRVFSSRPKEEQSKWLNNLIENERFS